MNRERRESLAEGYSRGSRLLAGLPASRREADEGRRPDGPPSFARGTPLREVIERHAAAAGIDPMRLRSDVELAWSVQAIVASCGGTSGDLLLSGRLTRKQLGSLSRTHPERQRYEVVAVAAGRALYAKPTHGPPPFDTVGWHEISSRLRRAAGMVRRAVEEVELVGGSGAGTCELRRRFERCGELADAHRGLLGPPLCIDASSSDRPAAPSAARRPRAADRRPASRRLPVRWLAPALGLLEKNLRDLPRLIREREPERRHVEQSLLRLAEIERMAGGASVPLDVGRPSESAAGLTYLGGDSRGGTYVLRIRVATDLAIAFGRFKRGKVVPVPAGEYAYVGSALADGGATCLARRLVRHATRTGLRPPHAIRAAMLDEFPALGLGDGELRPAGGKHLRWNVDHLLDRPEAELAGATIVRSPVGVEFALADSIVADAASVILEPGLGANDHPGGTHLVRVEAGDDWWRDLPARAARLIESRRVASPTSRRPLRGRCPGGETALTGGAPEPLPPSPDVRSLAGPAEPIPHDVPLDESEASGKG